MRLALISISPDVADVPRRRDERQRRHDQEPNVELREPLLDADRQNDPRDLPKLLAKATGWL